MAFPRLHSPPPQPRAGRRDVLYSLLRRCHPHPTAASGGSLPHIPTGGKSFQGLDHMPACCPPIFLSWRKRRKGPCPSPLLPASPPAPNPGRCTGGPWLELGTHSTHQEGALRTPFPHPSGLPPSVCGRRGLARQEEHRRELRGWWEGILRLSRHLPHTPLCPTSPSRCISHSSPLPAGAPGDFTPPPLCTPLPSSWNALPGLASQLNSCSSFKSRGTHPLLWNSP